MIKFLAFLTGLGLITVGILGFLPDFTTDGKLFGFLEVTTWLNIAHILSGVVALVCGLVSPLSAKIFFILFGLVYASIATLGFLQGEGHLFNFIPTSLWSNTLHALIALISLYIGLFVKAKK